MAETLLYLRASSDSVRANTVVKAAMSAPVVNHLWASERGIPHRRIRPPELAD